MKYIIAILIVYAVLWYLVAVILHVSKEQNNKESADPDLTIDELIN